MTITNLVIVGVVQIFLILLVLLHLVSHRPLSRGRVPVVHRVVGVPSGTDIGPGGESSGTAGEMQIRSKVSNHKWFLKHNGVLLGQRL